MEEVLLFCLFINGVGNFLKKKKKSLFPEFLFEMPLEVEQLAPWETSVCHFHKS